MLWLVQRVFFGPLKEPQGQADQGSVRDLSFREIELLILTHTTRSLQCNSFRWTRTRITDPWALTLKRSFVQRKKPSYDDQTSSDLDQKEKVRGPAERIRYITREAEELTGQASLIVKQPSNSTPNPFHPKPECLKRLPVEEDAIVLTADQKVTITDALENHLLQAANCIFEQAPNGNESLAPRIF